MEYRLIRHRLTGETLVIGGDGYLSPPLSEGAYLTADARLRAEWWRVERGEYNTALWGHPLWAVLASRQAPADGRHVLTAGVADPPGSGAWPAGPLLGETAGYTGYCGAGATG